MNWDRLTDALCTDGFYIDREFLRVDEVKSLSAEVDELREKKSFRVAGVGKGEAWTIDSSTRRDEVYWLDPVGLTDPQRVLWKRLEKLREKVNTDLFLGLWDLEGHYALYPQGAFYRRHLDRFRRDDARILSVVVYLNESWERSDGGQLRIYPPTDNAADYIDVEPQPGTLACFLSDRISHEVLPARKLRKSFAGWYKRR